MDKRYKFNTIDLPDLGEYAGYALGTINFKYNNTDYDHEFLFRCKDIKNGESMEMVTIDYGYKIPYIDEVWDEIEKYLIKYCEKMGYRNEL